MMEDSGEDDMPSVMIGSAIGAVHPKTAAAVSRASPQPTVRNLAKPPLAPKKKNVAEIKETKSAKPQPAAVAATAATKAAVAAVAQQKMVAVAKKPQPPKQLTKAPEAKAPETKAANLKPTTLKPSAAAAAAAAVTTKPQQLVKKPQEKKQEPGQGPAKRVKLTKQAAPEQAAPEEEADPDQEETKDDTAGTEKEKFLPLDLSLSPEEQQKRTWFARLAAAHERTNIANADNEKRKRDGDATLHADTEALSSQVAKLFAALPKVAFGWLNEFVNQNNNNLDGVANATGKKTKRKTKETKEREKAQNAQRARENQATKAAILNVRLDGQDKQRREGSALFQVGELFVQLAGAISPHKTFKFRGIKRSFDRLPDGTGKARSETVDQDRTLLNAVDTQYADCQAKRSGALFAVPPLVAIVRNAYVENALQQQRTRRQELAAVIDAVQMRLNEAVLEQSGGAADNKEQREALQLELDAARLTLKLFNQGVAQNAGFQFDEETGACITMRDAWDNMLRIIKFVAFFLIFSLTLVLGLASRYSDKFSSTSSPSRCWAKHKAQQLSTASTTQRSHTLTSAHYGHMYRPQTA